jgi:predicted peptidase
MSDTGFLPRVLTMGRVTHRYQVYVPRDFDPARRWPVILFLHGSGECGSDGARQTEVGLGPAVRRRRGRFPAIVVFPQARARTFWRGRTAEMAMRALALAVDEFAGDHERLHLTGLSLGGNGTWEVALEHPRTFASLVPICGWVGRRLPTESPSVRPLVERARALRHLPTWVFHGSSDRAVPVQESRAMVEALRAAGASALRYSEYPRVRHDSWTRAYAERSLFRWMLAQRRA